MSKHPIKPASRLLSLEEQNHNIINDVLSAASESNTNFSGTRTVTPKAARAIALRSLEKNSDESYSVRRHRALAELSSYTAMLQRDRIVGNALNHADLLPIAHPRSTRDHELSGAELFEHRSRWVLDDPKITDTTVRTLLASALTAHPATTEYEYAVARLEAMPQGTVPQYALVAALGDGNSSAARRARAMLQRRDRKGRFAEMGGGLRALIRMANKAVRSLTGRALVQGINTDTFDMELPDGKIVRVPATSAEAVKAILPSQQTKDGYSKSPASYKTGDPIIDEADLEFVDAPDGFNEDPDWSPDEDDLDYYGTKIDLGTKYTDDAYDVIKFDKPNAKANDLFEIAQQKESEGQNIVTVGKGKKNWLDPNLPVYFVSRRDGKDKTFAAVQSWADALDFIRQDEPKYEAGDLVNPKKTASGKAPKVKATLPKGEDAPDTDAPDAPEAPEADAPEAPEVPQAEAPEGPPPGYYDVDTESPYIPEGPVDGQESPDFTDDPVELAQRYDTQELKDALEESVKGTPDDPGTGFGPLPFEDGDEMVPAEAIASALEEQGEDIESVLGDIYAGADGGDAQAPEGVEVPEVSDDVKEALGEDLDAPAQKSDKPTQAPPLIEGMTEDERKAFDETGEYKSYLPENPGLDEEDIPEGYTALDPEPFNVDEAVLPEDAPEGFSMNPVDIANNYETEGLKEEFRRALEPGNEMPGYGILGTETPEGEEYVGYVPGEAIRDALQLQGVDTTTLANDIYNEGEEGQADDALTPEEVDKALEGEGESPEAPEGPAPEAEEEPAEAPQPTAEDEEGPGATGVKTGLPTNPAKLSAKTKELQPGDVTANDFFTIESVEPSDVPGKSLITGYYPGHTSQSTKKWNNETNIDVYRNVTPPEKGDLPELSKPFAKDYGKVKPSPDGYEYGPFQPVDPEAKEKYEADWDEYNNAMATAKGMWSPPEDVEEWQTEDAAPIYTVENSIGVTNVPATDVQPGDITFKKEWGKDYYEFFVVEGVTTDDDGNAVVQGYYPGHESQTKTWKGTTKISVMRGADAPEAGDKPALERPSKDDPDYEAKKAAFDEAKQASAATYDAPIDLEEADFRIAPKRPTPPAFMGETLKQLIAEADGDPKKFKELLDQEEVFHIDFESTGGFASPSPIQVAITKTQNGEVQDQLVLFMNPEQPLDDFYTGKDPADILKDSEGNPISDEFLAGQMSQEDAFKQIFDFMGDSPIVSAHNMPFDGGILKAYADKFGMDYTPGGEIDTLSLARKVMGGAKGHRLEEVAAKFDLAGPDTDWHDASVDVAVLPGILDALMDQMASTGKGRDQLDIDKTQADFDKFNAIYLDQKEKGKKADSELIMVQAFKKGMAGDSDLPTTEELVEKLAVDKPLSEEIGPATTPKPNEVSDGDFETESPLGGLVSNNWVEDDENTTNVGKVAVEDMQVGDFIGAKFGGFHEIVEIEEDPDDPKRMRLTTRLLANGKEYAKSWIRYQAYEIRRRNGIPEATPEPEEVPTPAVEAIDEEPEKQEEVGKWQGYTVAQGTDGVYYAEGISGSDVQKLRNGQLTPPNLPFFAPLGGGNNQETGEGYYFDTKGNRHWGKYGAAGALVRRINSDGQYEYLLAKRSKGLSQGGGKWAYPGGAHKDQDTAKTIGATAKEEFMEEVGGDLTALEPVSVHENSLAPDWSYDTYIFEVGANQMGDLAVGDGENSEIGWFTADQMQQMADEGKLIPEFADSLPAILTFGDDDTTGPEKPTPDTDGADPGEVSNFFDTSDWQKIGGQAGSNEGAFYVDPKTGDEYYVKKPKSEKHAANEALASAFYEEAGVKTGRVFLGKDKKGNTVLVSPLVPNSNADFGSKKDNPDIKSKAQEDFAVDAWLNNWDSVGLVYDNMLTDDEGNVYRIDPGGSLIFRAQGKDKTDTLTPEVTQIDSLRDPDVNAQAADIFGDMTDEQLAESAKKVAAISPEKIDELVDAAFDDVDPETGNLIKERLKARREYLIERFNLAEEEKEEQEVQKVSSPGSVLALDPDGDIKAQIASAVENNQKVSFFYSGKDRIVTPVKAKDGGPSIWDNPKNGKTNFVAIDSDGTKKNFTLSKMESNSDGFEPPVSDAPETEAPEAPTPEAEAPETPEAPEAEVLSEPLPDTEKSTEISEAEKQAVLDEVANLAEKLFGNQGKTKDLLEALKGTEGVDNDLIDSIISDIDAPSLPEDATPEQKVADDITQALTPEDGDEDVPDDVAAEISADALAEEVSAPKDPDTIWQTVQDDYDSTTLPNGHIVVSSSTDGTDKYEVLVRRNSDNTFQVYHRITLGDGTTRVKVMKGRWHSFTALKSRIDTEIWKSKNTPGKIKGSSKKETAGTILPEAAPTKKGAYVSADGSTVITVGMKVKDTKLDKKSGQYLTGTVVSLKDEHSTKVNGKVYTYTDVAKVQWDPVTLEDGTTYTKPKNWKSSLYLLPEGGDGGGGGGGTPDAPEPTTPSGAEIPDVVPEPVKVTPDDDTVTAAGVETPTYNGPEIGSATSVSDVESLAAAKNSNEHLAYFGAENYSDYKEFLKGMFLKDPDSKNMVPGILVSNANPNGPDPELTSHGVITKQDAKANEIEVTFFDGPLAGQTQTLDNSKVWSREKFLTADQAKELGADVDSAYLDKAQAASKAKGEKYAKELEAKKKKAEQEAADKAMKAKFEVNGPGFSLQAQQTDSPDWTSSPVDNAPSLTDALAVANSDDKASAAKGATFLGDSDAIEDLEIRVQKVTAKGGKEKILVRFTLTDWAANPRVAEMMDDDSIAKSDGLDLDKYEVQPDGSLRRKSAWAGGSVDQYGNGVTYSGKAGKGTFKLHRAKKGAEKADFFKHASGSSYSVAFHNKAEIFLPADATPEDISDALKEFGAIGNVRPATKEDIKGLVENKMIWLYGRNTDGTKNYAGELREKKLKEIEEEFGFTADDVEVSVDPSGRGRIQYLIPESAAQKIASDTGATVFYHNWQSSHPSGSQEYADWLFDIFMSGGLYPTTERWMNGINVSGMSSKADVKANGGNYMFTHQGTSVDTSGSSLRFYFDGSKLLRRMDFYKNNSDKYGQLSSESEDVIDKLKGGYGEIMWKKNLSWADLAGVSMPANVRKLLIEKLTQSGNEVIGDTNVVDILKKGGN